MGKKKLIPILTTLLFLLLSQNVFASKIYSDKIHKSILKYKEHVETVGGFGSNFNTSTTQGKTGSSYSPFTTGYSFGTTSSYSSGFGISTPTSDTSFGTGSAHGFFTTAGETNAGGTSKETKRINAGYISIPYPKISNKKISKKDYKALENHFKKHGLKNIKKLTKKWKFKSYKELHKEVWAIENKIHPYTNLSFLCYIKGNIAKSSQDKFKYKLKHIGADTKKAKKYFVNDIKKQYSIYKKKYGNPSDAEKIGIVANYVTTKLEHKENAIIRKNGKKYYSGNNLYTVYKTGCGVCEDYSYLFHIAAKAIGLQDYIVIGEATSGDVNTGHAWNLVYYNGRYFDVDSTWDDIGDGTGELDSYHFALKPDVRDVYFYYNPS